MDPFAVLGLARAYDVDHKTLEKQHREISRAVHPDRYANASPSERRAALSRAVEVNQAFRILKDPVRRAEALFELAGIPVGEGNEPKASPALLMDVIERREALAEAKASRDLEAVRKLARSIESRAKDVERELSAGFRAHAEQVRAAPERNEETRALADLVARLGELRFYRRFLEEVSAAEDESEGIA